MLISLVLVAQLILGGIFLKAGFSKIFSPSITAEHIRDYQLLSGSQERLATYILPLLEISAGLSYITGFLVKVGSIITALLLLTFSLAVIVNLRKGRRFNCHCFGKSNTPIGVPMLLRNLLLVTLSGFLIQQSFSNPHLTQLASWWSAEVGLFVHMDSLFFIFISLATLLGTLAIIDASSVLLYDKPNI